MEKKISLSRDEADALLDMSMFSCINDIGEVAESALRKLSNLCREFDVESESTEHIPMRGRIAPAA